MVTILVILDGASEPLGAALTVCPDHGCDPVTGEHDASPVPCATWPAAVTHGQRLTERTVARLPVTALSAPRPVAA